jgi:hypothetical protein
MSELVNRQAGGYVRGAKRDPRVLPVLLALVVVVAALSSGHVAALDAAGAFKGNAIDHAEHFIKGIEGNVVWLGETAMGLAVGVIAILFMAGHRQAHEIALKTGVGLFILASASGIVA